MDRLLGPLSAGCLALILAGCGASPPPPSRVGGTPQPAFSSRPAPTAAWAAAFDSAEQLAAAALDRLAAGDRAGLAELALSEHELRASVWPALPASRPEVGMPWEYFWRDHAARSGAHLAALVSQHGGRRYRLANVTFDGETTYADVTIHREPALDVEAPGGSSRMRLFGSMAERNGRWKLYSFIVD